MNIKSIILLFIFGTLFLAQGTLSMGEDIGQQIFIKQDQRVMEWRKDRDDFSRPMSVPPSPPMRKGILEA